MTSSVPLLLLVILSLYSSPVIGDSQDVNALWETLGILLRCPPPPFSDSSLVSRACQYLTNCRWRREQPRRLHEDFMKPPRSLRNHRGSRRPRERSMMPSRRIHLMDSPAPPRLLHGAFVEPSWSLYGAFADPSPIKQAPNATAAP